MNDFYYALSLLETLYGISLQEEDFEEIAIIAFNDIGNRRSRLYRYHTCLKDCENTVQLPCNCEIIEAVTADFEDFQHVSNAHDRGVPGSFSTEQYIESQKAFQNPLYISGKFVPYERVGDTLYLHDHVKHVNILYKGQILDDKGLPQITDKEARAIATYVAYVTKFKESLVNPNKQNAELAQMLEKRWYTQCDQARVPAYVNQNEMDEILDAKNSWNRKIQGKSYKPLR